MKIRTIREARIGDCLVWDSELDVPYLVVHIDSKIVRLLCAENSRTYDMDMLPYDACPVDCIDLIYRHASYKL